MDHIVYLDKKANELTNLTLGKKTMIVRGAMGKRIPYKKVKEGEILYFVEDKSDSLVKAKGKVDSLFFSEKLTREGSFELIDKYQDLLLLNTAQKKRFAGKRHLSIITIKDFSVLKHPFKIDKFNYSNRDDWIALENINEVFPKQKI